MSRVVADEENFDDAPQAQDSLLAHKSELIDALLRDKKGYIDPGENGVGYWEHFLHRGHKGKVNCVAASEQVDYIVTGGDDYTMRVWNYDMMTDEGKGSVETKAYELCGCVMHDVEFQQDAMVASDLIQPKGFLHKIKSTMGFGGASSDVEEQAVGVTAVACVGTHGPFISGTALGSVYVVALDVQQGDEEGDPWAVQVKRHDKKINDLNVVGGLNEYGVGILGRTPLSGVPWSVMVASDDHSASVVKFKFKQFSCLKLRKPHKKPVLQVRHLQSPPNEEVEGWLTYASSTVDAVYLWDGDGRCLHELSNMWRIMELETDADGHQRPKLKTETPDNPSMAELAVNNNKDGSLIFAGNGELPRGGVSVWNVERGKLCDPHGQIPDDFEPKVPIISYLHVGKMFDIEKRPTRLSFGLDIRDDFNITLWNLQGVQAKMLAIEPRAAVNKLAAPEHNDHVMCTMTSKSRCTALAVAEDPDDTGGPALLLGCEDGSATLWDLSGVDIGEVAAEVRSLSWLELLLPVFVTVFTFFQVISFAFGPAVHWRDEVKSPMNFTRKFVFLEMDVVIDIDRQFIFWPEAIAAMTVMILFLFCAFSPIQELLDMGIRRVQSTRYYKDKSASLHTPFKLLQRTLSTFAAGINAFMLVCATLGVVPVFKKVAEAVDCVHPKGGMDWKDFFDQIFRGVQLDKDTQAHLGVAPHIICFQGQHRIFYITLFMVVPAYILVLIPYAVVEGDCRYVSTTKVWKGIYETFQFFKGMLTKCRSPFKTADEHHWVSSARRKATVVDKGFIHPNPQTVFLTLVVEVLSKAALPVICIETTKHPKVQVCLVAFVGSVMCYVAFAFPPMAHVKWCRVIQGARVFTLCAMGCGVLTCFMTKGSIVPLLVLAALAGIIPTFTAFFVIREDISRGDVQHMMTSDVEPDGCEGVDEEWTNTLAGNRRSSRGGAPRLKGFLRKFKIS